MGKKFFFLPKIGNSTKKIVGKILISFHSIYIMQQSIFTNYIIQAESVD